MKNLITSITMNAILATTISAQGHYSTPAPYGVQHMTPTPNWLAAHRQTLGANTPANWLMDLGADELEIYVTPEQALVLVDRAPLITEEGSAYLRKSVNGLGGTHLTLVGEVDNVSDSVLRGVYSGLLGGTAVLMDQYVQLRNGLPVALVRVITKVNGSLPVVDSDQDQLIVELLDAPAAGGVTPAQPSSTPE